MRISVVVDCLDPASLVPFWTAALGYRDAGALPGYRVLAPPADDAAGGPVVVLQEVPEPLVGKPRVHLDVHPPVGGVEALVRRLEQLGGRRRGGPVTDLLPVAGIWWQVVADPEGHLVCVVADPGSPPPGGAEPSDGGGG